MSLLFPEIVVRDLEKGEISFNPVFGIWSKPNNLDKPCFQGKLPMESTQQMFAQGKKERGGREERNPNSHKSFIRKVTHQRDCHKSFCHHMLINRSSQVALVVKNLPAKAGSMRHRFDPCVGKIPWKRAWQPIQIFLPRESHGQRL